MLSPRAPEMRNWIVFFLISKKSDPWALENDIPGYSGELVIEWSLTDGQVCGLWDVGAYQFKKKWGSGKCANIVSSNKKEIGHTFRLKCQGIPFKSVYFPF